MVGVTATLPCLERSRLSEWHARQPLHRGRHVSHRLRPAHERRKIHLHIILLLLVICIIHFLSNAVTL
jgi:hypothetical protein